MKNETTMIEHECDCGDIVRATVVYLGNGKPAETRERCRKCRTIWRITTWISHKGLSVSDWARAK